MDSIGDALQTKIRPEFEVFILVDYLNHTFLCFTLPPTFPKINSFIHLIEA